MSKQQSHCLVRLFRMFKICRLNWLLLALASAWILQITHDGVRLSAVETVAMPHQFGVVQWEISNLPDKWVNLFVSKSLWLRESENGRIDIIQEYFRLTQSRTSEVQRSTVGLESLDDILERKRAAVEEALEATISRVVTETGLASIGGFILPPVDIRLTKPPKLLVTSPRDKIKRIDGILLSPQVTLAERITIETSISKDTNLSALVTDIGGVATYPAFVFENGSLRSTLHLAAHEWLHHYLAFRPLGRNYFRNSDMKTLNETFANMAGREIGDLAYILLGGQIESATGVVTEKGNDVGGFNFDHEMRTTREETDRLLSEGQIEGAERYMEKRRLLFWNNGYRIRKLNQAYFAFHGTYGESAASMSPIGHQMQEFRQLSTDLVAFLNIMANVSTYEQFLMELEELRNTNTIQSKK